MVDNAEIVVPDKKKKLDAKKLLILAVALVLASAGGGAGFWVWKHGVPGKSAVRHVSAVKAGPPVLVSIPTVVSNLDAGSGRTQFVKINATIEVNDADDAQHVSAAMPKIQDMFQTYLRETRPDELRGSGGYRLKEAMLEQIGVIVDPVPVRNLYFMELLVQ